jgi:hypothetical protein
MTEQPDFEQLFMRHFGGKPHKACYEARFNSSLLHDLQFLSSLAHESVIHPQEVTRRAGELRLPLTRECWEFPKIEKNGIIHLYIAKSVLSFRQVISVRWELPHDKIERSENGLVIKGLHLCFDYWEPEVPGFTLLVHGVDWKCIVKFSTEEPRVFLRDQTVPVPDWEFFR